MKIIFHSCCLIWTVYSIDILFGEFNQSNISKRTNHNNATNSTSKQINLNENIEDDINNFNKNIMEKNYLAKIDTISDMSSSSVANESIIKKLSRKKRYLAFPEGSSFSVAFCATVGFVGNPQYIYFSWGLNWGLAYELPNQTWIINEMHRKKKKMPKPVIQRRHRRDLYKKLEIVIDNIGYNGRSCVLRALCESSQYFYPVGTNMVEEILRTIFSLPSSNVLSFEHPDLYEYDMAFRKGQIHTHCPFLYPDCSISLIELALGTYSNQ